MKPLSLILELRNSQILELSNSGLRKINEKIAITSQFDLIRFYDVIIRKSYF